MLKSLFKKSNWNIQGGAIRHHPIYETHREIHHITKERNDDMNYYETRIAVLKKVKSLDPEVFTDGRNRCKTIKQDTSHLNKGDKIFPTVWFLRNVSNLDIIPHIAKYGLTLKSIEKIYDPESKFEFGRWVGDYMTNLVFEEVDETISTKYSLSSLIWKIIPIPDGVTDEFIIKKVEAITDIPNGSSVILTGGHKYDQIFQNVSVKSSESDGTEIIIDSRLNEYFNLGMYLEGKSWVKKLHVIKRWWE